MAEYINREELIENLNRFAPEHYNALVNDLILKQPAADVIEVTAIVEYSRKIAKAAKQKMKRALPYSNRYYQFWGCKMAFQCFIKKIKKELFKQEK